MSKSVTQVRTFRNVESRNKYIRREIDKRTMQSIADEVGISRQRVQQILERKFDFRVNDAIRIKRKEKRDKEIVRLYSKGKIAAELASRFNVGYSTINCLLRKYGVPRHQKRNAWWRKPLALKRLAKEIMANGIVATSGYHGICNHKLVEALKEAGFTYIKNPKNKRMRIVIARKGL